VVASMGDLAASGGYFIACGADRIFAQPATLTGSIGVVTAKPVLAGLYDKYGIGRTPITSHEHADATSAHRGWTSEEKGWVEGLIQYDYGQFLDVVAASRKIERTRLEEIAQGRVYTGERALAIGLVDELGSFEDALAYARKQAHLPADAPVEFVGLRAGFWKRVPDAAATLMGAAY
jgi:protease-4